VSMAEVTNELIYEVLKQVQSDTAGMKPAWHETNARLNAMQTHTIASQQDVQNIYSVLTRHDVRLERIERRLEIVELA
jgi:hypothetical protein